jgi:putative copper export protein
METALVVVHVLAAATWVGGTIALVFVAVPVARQLEGPARAAALAS